MDYIRASLQFMFLLICNIVLDLIGLVVVAIAIPFRVDGVSVSDERKISNLPKWVWLFCNDYDGLLGDKRVRDKAGQQGWQFVTTENNGRKWYGFYLVHLWSNERAFVIRLGFKTEPSDAGSKERQGMTTKINLYKSI